MADTGRSNLGRQLYQRRVGVRVRVAALAPGTKRWQHGRQRGRRGYQWPSLVPFPVL